MTYNFVFEKKDFIPIAGYVTCGRRMDESLKGNNSNDYMDVMSPRMMGKCVLFSLYHMSSLIGIASTAAFGLEKLIN